MGLYGNIMFEQECDFDFSYTIDESKAMSPLDFIEYCEESVLETDLLFESFGILNEENDLVFSDKEISGDAKETGSSSSKKSNIGTKFVETLKKLWNSFCNMIMKAWHTVSDKIKELYEKTNLTDSFISKIGKNTVTWENWTKTISNNSCPGLSTNYPVIGRMIDAKEDTNFSLYKEEIDKLIDLVNDTEKIKQYITPQVDVEKAKDIYDDINDKLSKIKLKEHPIEASIIYAQHNAIIKSQMNQASDPTYQGPKPEEFLFYTLNNGKDDKHYQPDARGFIATKNMAETGQKICKDYKRNANNTIAAYKKTMIKDNKEMFYTNKKDSIVKRDQTDKNIALIESLYYKAKINCFKKYVSFKTKCFKSSITMMYQQHRVAIMTYMAMYNVIKKYAKE